MTMQQMGSPNWRPSRLEKYLWGLLVVSATVYAVLFGVSPIKFVPLVLTPVAVVYLLYRIATR